MVTVGVDESLAPELGWLIILNLSIQELAE
jgi:hypothetical protein